MRRRGDRRPSAAALGALLDGSLTQIADASADARRFDRESVRAAADVWDNGTYPLFRAATALTRRGRERRARVLLKWLADLGEQRRTWILERTSAAGHSLDRLLPPTEPWCGPWRDPDGHVMAPMGERLTRSSAGELAADYDMATAQVHDLRVELAGSRLVGHVRLDVDRSFPVGGGEPPEQANLYLWLEDVAEVSFDSLDARGASLDGSSTGEASIRIGTRGALRAATAHYSLKDPYWYASVTGRRADATEERRESRTARATSPPWRYLGPAAWAAATVLRRAMVEIRGVRFPRHCEEIPVRALHRAFAGAGEAILAAGAHRLPHRREAAFRELIRTWAGRGGPGLAHWFATVLRDEARRSKHLTELHEALSGRVGAPDRSPTDAQQADDPPARPDPDGPGPARSELRLAMYTSDRNQFGGDREASGLIHLAVPPGPEDGDSAAWRLREDATPDPARFRVRTEAFRGAARPRTTVDEEGARHLVLGDGALEITGRNRVADPRRTPER
ncbi:hypothetical protein ACWCPT_12095 [Streptomyces sp. NPDC002308]